MKKVLLASACLFALAAPASAADLAARPYTKAPVAIASVYNWTGFYIGANAGVLVQSDHIKQDVDMGLVRLNYKFGGPIIGKY